jgi:hypothetical protein
LTRPSPTAPAPIARPPPNPPFKDRLEGFKAFSDITVATAICGGCKTAYTGYIAVPTLTILEPYPSREEPLIKAAYSTGSTVERCRLWIQPLKHIPLFFYIPGIL